MAGRDTSRIEHLYRAARALPESARESFLDEGCGDDAELRREVDSLLAQEAQPEPLLRVPGIDGTIQPPGVVVGTRLGHYEILELVGAGGMGEVYRARDARLGRDVAIKVLPAEFARRPERVARFEREAHALAALNHTGIAAIHGLEELDSIRFLVLELVPGNTLAERLLRGRLPVGEALRLGAEIAAALGAAHDRGIIHRDVKPSNVVLTPEGHCRLLDFGVAKLLDASVYPEDERTLTGAGDVCGTPGYMSPEQARGEAAAHGADVWAFGCVLFEMLIGERVFREPSRAATIASILTRDPEWARLPAEVPGMVRTLLRRCLDKQPARRPKDMRDLSLWLEEAERELRESLPTPASPTRPSYRRVSIAALACAAAAGLLAWLLMPPALRKPLEIRPFTTDGGLKAAPKLSPDGEEVAYEWAGASGDNWDIYVKAMGLGSIPLRLTDHPAADVAPAWSPDGRQVAFVREAHAAIFESRDEGASIYTVPSLGGAERKLADVAGRVWLYDDAYFVPALTWSPDGEWLALPESGGEDDAAHLVLLSVRSLEKRQVTFPPPASVGDFYPAFSPDGRRIAFVRSGELEGNQDVWVVDLDDEVTRRLTHESYQGCHSVAWTDSGDEIIYEATSEGRVFRVGRSGGEPQPIAGIGISAAAVTVRNDRLIYSQLQAPPWSIWKLQGPGSDGREPASQRLIASSQPDAAPAISPDGEKIAFQSWRDGVANIWLSEADGSKPVPLTRFDRRTGGARWSPNGTRLVLHSLESGNWDLYVVDATGANLRQLTSGPAAEFRGSWSRDGQWIYYSSNATGSRELWRIPVDGGDAVQVTQTGGVYGEESKDGTELFYVRSEAGSGLWRMSLPGGESRELVPGPIHWADWTVEGNALYFAKVERAPTGQRYSLRRMDLVTGEVRELWSKQGPFKHQGVDVSPGEEWILFAEIPDWTSELMLVENFR